VDRGIARAFAAESSHLRAGRQDYRQGVAWSSHLTISVITVVLIYVKRLWKFKYGVHLRG
jgi:hypothetical protein